MSKEYAGTNAAAVKSNKGLKITLISILCVLILGGGMLAFAWQSGWFVDESSYIRMIDSGEIYEGVTVNGIEVGGMKISEAKEAVSKSETQKIESVSISLKYNDQSYEIKGSEIYKASNIDDMINQAMLHGRTGSLLQRKEDIKDALENGINFESEIEYGTDHVQRIVSKIAEEVNEQPQDPTVTVVNPDAKGLDKFEFVEGITGVEVNTETLVAMLGKLIEEKDYTKEVQIPVNETPPHTTLEQMKANFVLRGEASTSFSGTGNRTYNLNKSIELIRGENGYYLMKPGDIMSLNDTLGPRTAALGWKAAGAFVNGRLEDEIGGGVCQISSTLYVATLRADLEIVSRRSHSRPVSYLTNLNLNGFDATIDTGRIDYQFKNNTSHDIYIFPRIDKSKLYYEIYGEPLANGIDEIVLYSKQVSTIAPGAPQIKYDETKTVDYQQREEPAKQGAVYKAWKHYMKDGVKVAEVEVASTTYRALPEIWTYGTLPVMNPEPEITEPDITPSPEPQPTEAPPETDNP